MKRLRLVFCLFLVANFPAGLHAQSFKAGAAKVNITPSVGTLINGDFVGHYAKMVHDSLFVKAIVMQKGKTISAIVVVDICEMLKDFLDPVKHEIEKQTGIPYSNILISSTHIHSGGSVESDFLAFADLPYRRRLPGLIVESVVQAKAKLKEAQVGFGAVDVPEHVRIRRYFMKEGYISSNPVTGKPDKVKTNPGGAADMIIGPAAKPDPQLSYLVIRGADKKYIALLGNYSMHYVGDWPDGTINGDYFEAFSNMIKSKLDAGKDFIGILSNGTSGDANIQEFQNPNLYPKENFAKTALIGNDLARKVTDNLSKIQWEDNPSLAVAYKEIPVRVQKPSRAELDTSLKILSRIDLESYSEWKGDDYLRNLFAYEQVMLNNLPDKLSMPVQAIRIGNGVIGGLAGEIFSETGLWLKKNSPVKHYFTIGLANGYVGYIPPAHEFANGGYETWRCRTCCLEENADELLRNQLLMLISSLK